MKANAVGAYHVPSIPPGPGYTSEFNADGFAPVQIKGIYVNLPSANTQNAQLEAAETTKIYARVVQLSARIHF